MSTTMANPDQLETWETTTHSMVAVNRYDRRGGERAHVVGGEPGRRVQVTSGEREDLNEERSANAEQDPFRNGMLRPVRGVPDEIVARFETETKPRGGLSLEEIVDALETKKAKDFEVWVDQLTEATLRQVAETAPAVDASASQLKTIETALERFGHNRLRETDADRQLRSTPTGME